jgi:hypothetical protein
MILHSVREKGNLSPGQFIPRTRSSISVRIGWSGGTRIVTAALEMCPECFCLLENEVRSNHEFWTLRIFR